MGSSAAQMVNGSSGERLMSVAYVFPGQGSQYVGMGKDLFEGNADARVLFEKADTILGFPLSKICFEGPEEELRLTKNTQPAIYLHSVILAKLYGKESASMAAGHSLGEYSALVYAGALSFEDGLKLVRLRGELMYDAGISQRGTMAAVVGLDPQRVNAICSEASSTGIVQAANFNSPGQIVISGSIDGVHKAMDLAKGQGAKLVKELPVSGAFHSPLMKPAQDGLKKALDETEIKEAKIPVYANVTARPVKRAEEIRESLHRQLTNPVRWEETVINMLHDGALRFVEIGPGKVLQGLIKRIDSTVSTHGIDKAGDLLA